MDFSNFTRRDFFKAAGVGAAMAALHSSTGGEEKMSETFDKSFLIDRSELDLRFSHGRGLCRLSFGKQSGAPEKWRTPCRRKFTELLGFKEPVAGKVRQLRQRQYQGVIIRALVMQISDDFSIPAYLLHPKRMAASQRALMAIHGHGIVEPCIGLHDDYHHFFALEMARAGHMVLCPELRGFGTLNDLAGGLKGSRLDYSPHDSNILVNDIFMHGGTLIGQTIEDLLRWEQWLCQSFSIEQIDAAGISYGGDIAFMYPVFSKRVRKIFASGTLGSFSVIYPQCFNAAAHCIPGVLNWMDRSDIAGLNAPRPIAIHYGELDTPSPKNYSASYNETVPQSLAELRTIYKAFGAEDEVRLIVTPGRGHEMDNNALRTFLAV